MWGKRARTARANWLGLLRFLGEVREKTTPSGMTLQYLRSNFAREAVLSGQARVKNITSFLDNCFRDRELLLPKEARCVVTFLTSQVYAYRGFGGREFSIPCMSLVTWGCWPARKLSILECVGEIAEGSTLMDRYSKPSEKAFAKNSRIFESGAENRINFPFSTPATPAGPCWLVGLSSGRPSCWKEQFGNLSRKAFCLIVLLEIRHTVRWRRGNIGCTLLGSEGSRMRCGLCGSNTGLLTRRLNRMGHHGCSCQIGATRMRSAFSWITLLRTTGIRMKWGKA